MAAMEAGIRWVSKLAFQGTSRGHHLMMDAKKESGGQDIGMSPKEMVLNGLCGCSGMDVISLLTSKFKLPVSHFEVKASAISSQGGHPVVWTEVKLEFIINGEVPVDQALKAVELSMTRYCGVSAMLSKACPIHYEVILNGDSVGTGEARF
jgi:putative redox protein